MSSNIKISKFLAIKIVFSKTYNQKIAQCKKSEKEKKKIKFEIKKQGTVIVNSEEAYDQLPVKCLKSFCFSKT